MEANDSEKKDKNFDSTVEYWKSLDKWMDSVRSLTMSCGMLGPGFPFPFAMGMNQRMGGPSAFNMPPPPVPPYFYAAVNATEPLNNNVRGPPQFVEHRVPPLWKRFIAETIDFVILFFVKLVITFIAVDWFQLVDFDKYDLSALQTEEKIDYELALEMTSDFIMLEMIHRIVVCFYESMFLAQEGEQPGGATPGKSLMGLRVISCEQIVPGAAADIVHVSPAGTMPLRHSIIRAILKNIVLAFVLPFAFPLFFSKFNRAGYDVMCRSIVVEETRPRRR